MAKPIRYDVYNRITGETRSFKTGKAASRAMDRMDLAYGAIITTRRAVWGD